MRHICRVSQILLPLLKKMECIAYFVGDKREPTLDAGVIGTSGKVF